MAKPVKVKDAQGNIIYMQIVKDDTGADKWEPMPGYTPPPATGARTKSGELIKKKGRGDIPVESVNLQMDQQQKAREELESDPAKMARAQMANNMTWGEKATVNLGREMGKFYTGAKDLGDMVLSNPGNPMIPASMKMEAMQRRESRADEEQLKDIQFKELADRSGSAVLGSLPFYLASGRVLDKPATAVVKKISEGISKVRPITNRVMAPVGNAIQNRAASGGDDMVTSMARSLDEGTVTPMRRRAAEIASRDPLSTSYRANPIQDLARDTLTGGVEGGVHYDDTVGSGALSSGLGSGSGLMTEQLYSKAKNLNTQADNDVLDWARLQGYRTTPGQDTGQPGYQRFESDLRSSDSYGGEMKQFDAANDKAINKVAGKVMGMDDVDLTNMTPSSLSSHMQNLKDQYELFESRSRGKMNRESVEELSGFIDNLPKKEKARAQEMYESVLGIRHTQGRNNGQFTASTFNGKDYAATRRKIKLAADSAYGKSNFAEADFYKNLIKKLDEGMERGVAEFGGEIGAQEWKDLNEKYAMSKLMLNKGFTSTGKVDLDKMYSHLMSQDAERTLMGRGGRITDLQQLIKLNEISKGQVGSGFARVDIGDEGSKQGSGSKVSFNSTPWSLRVPLASKARAKLYMSDSFSPARHGLLHMDPKSKLYNAASIGRAGQQSSDFYQKIMEGAYDEGKYVYDLWNQDEESMKDSKSKLKGLLE